MFAEPPHNSHDAAFNSFPSLPQHLLTDSGDFYDADIDSTQDFLINHDFFNLPDDLAVDEVKSTSVQEENPKAEEVKPVIVADKFGPTDIGSPDDEKIAVYRLLHKLLGSMIDDTIPPLVDRVEAMERQVANMSESIQDLRVMASPSSKIQDFKQNLARLSNEVDTIKDDVQRLDEWSDNFDSWGRTTHGLVSRIMTNKDVGEYPPKKSA